MKTLLFFISNVLVGILIISGILFLPHIAGAQNDLPDGPGGGPPVPAAGGGISNPLEGSASNISQLLTNIIRFLLGLVGLLAILSLIIGGIRLITAIGQEDKIKHAKQIILWAILGLATVFVAFFIVNLVSKLLGVN